MRIHNLRLINPPIKTRAGTIVALFSAAFDPVLIKDVRLRLNVDDEYSIAFSKEGMCSRIVVFEAERSALLAAAIAEFERRASGTRTRPSANEWRMSGASHR